jgi:signal recognition particle subunit SRP54
VFDALTDRFISIFGGLQDKETLTESDIDATAREIRLALLAADVALPVVKDFIEQVKDKAKRLEPSDALTPAQQIIKLVNAELITVLGGEARELRFAETGTTVIMLVGLQGAGKTTLSGKLAAHLKAQDKKVLLVAADLLRPSAVDQLKVLAGRAGVDVFAPEAGSGTGDAIAVARDGVAQARTAGYDVVIVDTAGRVSLDAQMMAQATAIRDEITPDEVVFVLDAMTGQDAVATAESFHTKVGLTGVVLTKLDGDSRGGAALSVRAVTSQPVLFASVGEKLEDFQQFHPERIAGRILNMGDVLTLIEKAELAFKPATREALADKLLAGREFTLADFLEMLNAVQNMGPLQSVMGMLPGVGKLRSHMNNLTDKDLKRAAAIVQAMTLAERLDPKKITGARKDKIAAGAGVDTIAVTNLIDRFAEAQKVVTRMRGTLGLPSVKRGPAKKRVKRNGVSGNPAKRGGKAPADELYELPDDFDLTDALTGQE